MVFHMVHGNHLVEFFVFRLVFIVYGSESAGQESFRVKMSETLAQVFYAALRMGSL